MSDKSRSRLSNLAWIFAFVLGAVGMYGATVKDRETAKREAQHAETEHQLAAAERELAQKERQEAIDRHKATQKFIAEFEYPVAMLDQTGQVVEWNAAAEKAFGWTKADLVTNGIASIIPEEMRAKHHESFSKAMVGSGKIVGRTDAPVQRVQCEVIHKDKRRKPIPVEVSVRVIEEADGDMYALAHIDLQKKILKLEADE